MYDSLFCRIYNEFGWNEYPRVFAEELVAWLDAGHIPVRTALDLGCGTGVLCETLHAHGVETLGIDLSADMIAIARERAPGLKYEVADMTAFRSPAPRDLVTCTGDALNHVTEAGDIRRVFANVWASLNLGGLFVFDLLRADEVPGESFEAPFGDGLTVRFAASRDQCGFTTLQIDGYRDGERAFSETIREKLYDAAEICGMLREAGFRVVQCSDHLLNDTRGTTWFVVARKEAGP